MMGVSSGAHSYFDQSVRERHAFLYRKDDIDLGHTFNAMRLAQRERNGNGTAADCERGVIKRWEYQGIGSSKRLKANTHRACDTLRSVSGDPNLFESAKGRT